ncbi:cytochrome-c peroxidase [Andreprevotia chitinilytica]|uniref:cytochrome-c peroxidase n=1 Tax=Andreprevotia chitinilytica TaxID=396808 RepID=UPI000553BAAF|nr:cytochrome c peroxidase [Andreprevotia chitinilytica]
MFSPSPHAVTLLSASLLLGLAGCGGGGASSTPAATAATPVPAAPSSAQLAALGKQIFSDPSLSGSGKMSCATCHDPNNAYAPSNNLAVQPGGAALTLSGTRTAPSLRYLQFVPAFSEHFFLNASTDAGPTGGLTWDGRVNTFADQAKLPFLSANEMANASPADFATRLQKASYAPQLLQVFGAGVFKDGTTALNAASQALHAFESTDASFNPYTSKYDQYLAGKVSLSTQELRGLALFNDPAKGNCAQCHVSTPGAGGLPPQFTDHGFVNLGVPRNPEIPANAVASYFDLGLCGPTRTDLASHTEYCGLFMTPSLRNVALRKSFFHNGRFHTLQDVMHFYVERDTKPEKWYPANADGSINQFDDLPVAYRGNVDMTDAPFGRQPGAAPALSETEIADVIVFMNTLTDGYQP